MTESSSGAAQHICQQTGEHYYASESIPGGLIHWIRICMTCGHKDEKDLNKQITTLFRETIQACKPEKEKRPEITGGTLNAWDSGFANGWNAALDEYETALLEAIK